MSGTEVGGPQTPGGAGSANGGAPDGWDTAKPLLAIDTSTLVAGLALYGEEGPLAELIWPAGRAQTTALLGEVDRLLALCGLRPPDLGAVAVATGPGSFNALRVGLSTAKGLAFALAVPLIGVPTLDATAYPHASGGRPVRATLAAGRGRLVSALYRWDGDGPRRVGDYANTTLEGLAALVLEPTLVCGELAGEAARQLTTLAPAAQLPPPAARGRRPAALAELAWGRLRDGETDDPATLEPVYLHGPATPAVRAEG